MLGTTAESSAQGGKLFPPPLRIGLRMTVYSWGGRRTVHNRFPGQPAFPTEVHRVFPRMCICSARGSRSAARSAVSEWSSTGPRSAPPSVWRGPGAETAAGESTVFVHNLVDMVLAPPCGSLGRLFVLAHRQPCLACDLILFVSSVTWL